MQVAQRRHALAPGRRVGWLPPLRRGFCAPRYLASTTEWRECGGCRHLLVLPRGAADYPTVASGGVGFAIDDPFWRNVHKLTVDAAPNGAWPKSVRQQIQHVHAVPWPSAIHPRDGAELARWQRYVAGAPRKHLVSLVCAYRSHRASLMSSCAAHPDCHHVLPNHGRQAFTREVFYTTYCSSVYCLMPRGDMPSRSAIFDALACGCIPVLDADNADGLDYPWHVTAREAAMLVAYRQNKGLVDWLKETPSGGGWWRLFVTGVITRIHPSPIDSVLTAIRARPAGAAERQRAHIIALLPQLLYSMPAPDAVAARSASSGAAPDAVGVALRHIGAITAAAHDRDAGYA